MLTQAIDWAVAENSRSGSPLRDRIDTSKIAVAGFSCGGLEAYAVSGVARVSTTMIFSSGLLNDGDDYQLRRLDHPIAYIIGGPSDIAYPNAIDDWGKLLGDTAAVTAMLDRLLHHGHVLKCGPRSWRTKTQLPGDEQPGK